MPRPVKASPVTRLASIYRDVAAMSDTDLSVGLVDRHGSDAG